MNTINAKFELNYGDFNLNVDLNIPNYGVSVLFGHSGSGKTSLLRCIAGLEKPQNGYLSVNGKIWQNDKIFMPTHDRPIGYVFQEASLFPHLNVRDNLLYAQRRAPKVERPIIFDQALTLLGIEKLLERKTHQLSGGERQRVAIARALLIQPRLLLMDEPLAALDLPRKLEILPYIERLKQDLELPIIYVSHAADEVARLADYLVAMKNGQVVAAGSLSETLSRLDFPLRLNEDTGVVLEATVIERDLEWKLAKVEFPGSTVWLRDNGHPTCTKIRIRILARDISLAKKRHNDTSIVNTLAATIEDIATDEHAGLALVRLKVSEGNQGESYLLARVSRRSAHHLGLTKDMAIWAQIKSVAVL